MFDTASEGATRTVTDVKLLKETAALLHDMADAMDETASSSESFSQICRNKNLDAKRVRRLMQIQNLQKCRVQAQLPLEQLDTSGILEPDFYEKFYQKVFGETLDGSVLLPLDYKEAAEKVISTMTEREQTVITDRLGKDGREMTLEEVGQKLNVTRSRICGLEKKIYQKARTGSNGRILKFGIAEFEKQQQAREALLKQMAAQPEPEPEKALTNQQRTYLEQPITELDLSSHARNALLRNQIDTIDKLVKQDAASLSEMRMLGPQSVCEIMEQIRLVQERILDMGEIPPENLRRLRLESGIGTLNLSVRSQNALMRAGINKVGILAALRPVQLQHIRSLGQKSVNETLEKITELSRELHLTPKEQLGYTLIDTLILPDGIIRSLHYAGIWTVNDFLEKKPEDLKKIRYPQDGDKNIVMKEYIRLQKEYAGDAATEL